MGGSANLVDLGADGGGDHPLGTGAQDRAPTQTGSWVTGGLGVGGWGDGGVAVGAPPAGAGALVAGAAVAAGGCWAGVPAWSAWLVRQLARAILASSRAGAMARIGRMMLIPLGAGRRRAAYFTRPLAAARELRSARAATARRSRVSVSVLKVGQRTGCSLTIAADQTTRPPR
jgi:hypothetical protein